MPNTALKNLAKSNNKPLAKVEQYWDFGKKKAQEKGLTGDEFYSYAMAIAQRRARGEEMASKETARFSKKDSLLNAITIEELITTVESNEEEYNQTTLNKVFNSLIQEAVKDAKHEFMKNRSQILKELKSTKASTVEATAELDALLDKLGALEQEINKEPDTDGDMEVAAIKELNAILADVQGE